MNESLIESSTKSPKHVHRGSCSSTRPCWSGNGDGVAPAVEVVAAPLLEEVAPAEPQPVPEPRRPSDIIAETLPRIRALAVARLPVHPLAQLIPEMTAEEFSRLKEDIRANGLRLPVLTYEGRILDGRHRARACIELGREYPTKKATGDPASIVASLNLVRRNLQPDQVAAIHLLLADSLARTSEPERQLALETQPPPKVPRRVGRESAEVAKTLGVSARTIDRVREVKRRAPERLVAVAKGQTKAEKVLREMKDSSSRSTTSPPAKPTAKGPGQRENESPLAFARRLAKGFDGKTPDVVTNIIEKVDFMSKDFVKRAHSPVAAARHLERLSLVLAALTRALLDAHKLLAAGGA